jgi:lipopolysaccharide biosynthesis regulator YciM
MRPGHTSTCCWAADRRCPWPSCWAGRRRASTCASGGASDRQAPKAYFKGLNLLLNEQTDKAIDAFIEAVQHDPDTSELHFALGNLFRRRGEFERAVRVHQHLLQRADLPRPTASVPSTRWRRTS